MSNREIAVIGISEGKRITRKIVKSKTFQNISAVNLDVYYDKDRFISDNSLLKSADYNGQIYNSIEELENILPDKQVIFAIENFEGNSSVETKKLFTEKNIESIKGVLSETKELLIISETNFDFVIIPVADVAKELDINVTVIQMIPEEKSYGTFKDIRQKAFKKLKPHVSRYIGCFLSQCPTEKVKEWTKGKEYELLAKDVYAEFLNIYKEFGME